MDMYLLLFVLNHQLILLQQALDLTSNNLLILYRQIQECNRNTYDSCYKNIIYYPIHIMEILYHSKSKTLNLSFQFYCYPSLYNFYSNFFYSSLNNKPNLHKHHIVDIRHHSQIRLYKVYQVYFNSLIQLYQPINQNLALYYLYVYSHQVDM